MKQPSANTCWAAVWTMMLSWRQGRPLTIGAAVEQLGEKWTQHLRRDEGMAAQTFSEDSFLKASKLNSKPPANYLPSAYVELLATHGPLWVNTGDGILNHATLLVSAKTDRDGKTEFQFNDPQEGALVTKTDQAYFAEFEREARIIADRKLPWDLRFQIFYWSSVPAGRWHSAAPPRASLKYLRDDSTRAWRARRRFVPRPRHRSPTSALNGIRRVRFALFRSTVSWAWSTLEG
ncbi:MAG TPA: papain-like cysteine protease family protein [Planctomycetaceae bacterium]|jgi:hypothetical protein|nr:papain-like cysteine protease family protein [Planctomycetaceae bacterium]